MAKRKQRKHSPEFKFRLVVEALRGERLRAEIAREHDITCFGSASNGHSP